MKRILLYTLSLGLLLWFRAPPAAAHYVYLQPQGNMSVTVGDRLNIGVYLHMENDDVIYGWGFSQVFDAVELSRLSHGFAYGENPVGSIGTVDYEHERDGFTYLARYDWSFKGYRVSAGDDYLLYSVTYVFNGGPMDGPDVWFDWNVGEDVFFEFETPPEGIGYVNTLPIQGAGPDFHGHTPKPVRDKSLSWLHLLLDDEGQKRIWISLGTSEGEE